MIFKYELKDLEALKKKDKKLKVAIDKIGLIERNMSPDLFESLIESIVSQQISNKAYETVYGRLKALTKINPADILAQTDDAIQACGLSFKKVGYIKGVADYFNRTHIQSLVALTDNELIGELIKLKGIGEWTAQMLLIFSLNRMHIFPKGDLGVKRGVSMLYHHKNVTSKLMDKYEKRYAPHQTIAALYLWEISSGKYGHKDYQVK